MTKSEPKQHFTLLSTLAANADLGQFSKEQIQVGISEPERAGAEFAAFVANGFRVQVEDLFLDTGELTIELPALPRPTLEELQKDWAGIESIERDTSTTEATTLTLFTVLRPTEKDSINGSEYERRIAVRQNSLLGYQHRNWVIEHQDEPALKELLGKIYIDFPALIVVDSSGSQNFPYANDNGKRWNPNWNWVSNDFNRNGRVAASSNLQ